MRKDEIDWSILKGPTILFSLCIVICSALVGGSYYFNSNLSKQYKQNKAVFQSTSRRYLDVDQEEKLLVDYYPQFVKLYNQGIIGREKRLNWIEALRQSAEKTRLPSLTYAIESQEEFIPGFNINYSGFTLYRSSMDLKLGLLHEGDFFTLLNHLDQTTEGLYTITECTFRRNGNQIRFEKNHANVSATCLLHWITINIGGGKGIEIL